MSLADELNKLAALRQSGALTDEEFQQAKEKLLSSPSPVIEPEYRRSPTGLPPIFDQGSGSDESLGKAANRYVTLQMVMAVIGIVIFLLFFAPMACRHSPRHFGSPNSPMLLP
jgi:hypothetical protein